MSKEQYESDIILGDKYIDEQTGMFGTAVSITFWQYSCERVGIETFDASTQQVRCEVFDSPRLKHVESGKVATAVKTGGDHKTPPQRGANTR